jgi:hypothetical protein
MAKTTKPYGKRTSPVFEYLQAHPHSTARAVAEALGADMRQVGGIIGSMRRRGQVSATCRHYPDTPHNPNGTNYPALGYVAHNRPRSKIDTARAMDLPVYEDLIAEIQTTAAEVCEEPEAPTHEESALRVAHSRIGELTAKVVELQSWKAKAIHRYPDLAVDPLVERARKIVAAQRPDRAARILDGTWDHSDPMRCTLAALRSLAPQGDVA